jgi:hypothetical protein
LQLEEKRRAAIEEEAAKRPIEKVEAAATTSAVEQLLAQTKPINKNNLPKIRRSVTLPVTLLGSTLLFGHVCVRYCWLAATASSS